MSALEIFKAGTHTDMHGRELSFSTDDLHATVAAYDPALFRAPLVVGHPQLNDPAYGWVSRLALQGDTLAADPEQVEPQFAAMVNDGRFPRVSASFFPPDHPNNPKPGVWYLRHVGFLGAAAPAVQGLKTASFHGDAEGIVTVEFATPDRDPQEEPTVPTPNDPSTLQQPADFAAREQELLQLKADLDARAKALAEQEAAVRKKEIADFAAQLVQDGRLLPRDQPGLVAFMASLDDASVVSFSAGTEQVEKPGSGWLRDFLQALPVQVDFAERGAARDEQQAAASFAAPQGYSVDPERLALHNKALAYQAQHNCDYSTAINAVS